MQFLETTPFKYVVMPAAIMMSLAGTAWGQAATPAPTVPTPTTPAPPVSAPDVTQLGQREVIGTTPLLGSGIDRDKVPAATVTIDSQDIQRDGNSDALRALNQQVGGVTLDSASGNPVSADLLLSRLPGIPAARHAAGACRLCQRHALQPAFRRHGGLGPDPGHRDRSAGHPGVEPCFRPQRARRLDKRPAQERLHLSRFRGRSFRRLLRSNTR